MSSVKTGSLLNDLGNKYGTDKSSQGKHRLDGGGGLDYLQLYDTILEKRRLEVRKVLEIGVLKGSSLRVWEEYFPNADIFGVDIHESALRAASKRTRIYLIDQSNKEALVDFAAENGPFDLIVEDGSHRWEHQISNIEWLIPHVAPGGIYIAEDLHTSYLPEYGSESQMTAVSYILNIAEDVIAANFRKRRPDSVNTPISARIKTVMAMRHAVAFSVY